MASIEHIWADEVVDGDELLVGPQGFRCPTNPTISFLRHETINGVDAIVADLLDEDGRETVLWTKHSRLTVFRRSP